jgi:hypothetical protein
MPRPKRTKVAPSGPVRRVGRPSKSTAVVEPAPSGPVRRVGRPSKSSSVIETAPPASRVSSDNIYDASDVEEGAVTNVRHMKKNNGKGKEIASPESSRAAPHLELGEAETEIQLGSEIRDQEDVLDDIDLDSSSPAVEVGRREQRTPAVESSLLAIGNFRRRARQPSILGRGNARARSSSVESNLAEDNGLMSVGKRNTSALAMGNFKRRQREPSILGQNAAPLSFSSIGEMERGIPAQVGSALKIGQFKRRAREPSILRTSQKARRNRMGYEDEDEDDFNPEDESTPLNLSKTKNMTTSSAASSSNSRKRKLSAVQVPQSQSSPRLPSPREIEAEDTIPATGPLSDEEDEATEPEFSPQEDLMPSIEARADTPELLSETMAPPLDSSSLPSSPEPALPVARRAASRGRRPTRGRTPPPRTQDSPIPSPPSLTHSPNRPLARAASTKANPKRQAPPPSTFSTAQLQNLLPRRRRRPVRDVFEIASSEDEVDASGLASDDDELSYLSVRTRTRRPTTLRRTPAPLTSKSKPGPKPKEPGAKRTYGSRNNTTSDKENEEIDPDDSLAPLPDDDENTSPENSQELEKRVGRELKEAARKFQEVDQWELEFEDVTASSSSPRDAR